MVVVAVGTQDRSQLQLVRFHEPQHWPCLAGIDHDSMAIVVDGPYVVILQGRDGGDIQHGNSITRTMPNFKRTVESQGEWIATPQGEYVLERERAYFDRIVTHMFGYNALQLGLPEHDFLEGNRMPLRIRAGNQTDNNVRLICTELPFDSDSMDLVLIPHVLEFSENPHQVLREVARVLHPEGNLIISGFNPRSLWGLHRALGRREGYPWQGHFIKLSRLRDWLSLLDFEVSEVRFGAYAPPFHSATWLDRFDFLEKAGDRWWAKGGGVYFVHAVKRVYGMRLIKPKWNEGLVSKLLPSTPKLNNRLTQRRKTGTQ